MSQFRVQKVVLEVFKAWQSSNNVRHALPGFIVPHKERNQRTRFTGAQEDAFGKRFCALEWSADSKKGMNKTTQADYQCQEGTFCPDGSARNYTCPG